jgi:hypothetical protein
MYHPYEKKENIYANEPRIRSEETTSGYQLQKCRTKAKQEKLSWTHLPEGK